MKKIEIEEIDFSKSYTGYLWYSDETSPKIFISELLSESAFTPLPFIVEGYLFSPVDGGVCLNIKNIDILDNKFNDYLKIPQNKVNFYDIIYKKVKINNGSLKIITNFAAHYKEVLVGENVVFEANIAEVGDDITKFGHLEYDCEGLEYSDNFNNIPEIDRKADFYLNKNKKFVNGLNKM